MVKELARDAVQIKMKAREESPLISVYEFCYAAGLAYRIMNISEQEARAVIEEKDFLKLKPAVQERVRNSDAFADYPNGERLKHLIVGCRFKGQMADEARQLFEMGYQKES